MTPLRTVQDLVYALPARGAHPAVVAVKDGGATETLSYAELGARALRLATGLIAAGVRPGDAVVLFGPNSPTWITVRLALATCGAVAVALDDLATDAELAVLLPDSKARIVFAAGAHVPRLAKLPDAATRRIYVLDRDDIAALLAPQPDALPAVAPESDCMLVFTSGTTGTPKSFLLTHANIMANVNGLAVEGIVDAADRALLPLPLHHVYPLTVGCLTALASGSTIVLPPGVTGPQIVAALQRARVTAIVGVPRLYAALVAGLEARVAARGAVARRVFAALLAFSRMMRQRFGMRLGRKLFTSLHRQLAPDLWLLASGGAKFEAELIWKLEALGWEVLSGYGLAETASILTANRRGRARVGSEGTPLPGAELRIAGAGADGSGEIETRGPSVFAGYRNNAEANATAFTVDGWFRTGDLGTIDADGFVAITGRVKEMIVLGGGKNIFPEEVETLYADSPFVRELAVLERSGALVALVLPNLEAIAATGSRRVEDVLRIALTERSQVLPSFQRISGYAVVREPLPRTRLGKYQRFLLPALYERAKSGAAPARGAELSEEDRALLARSPAHEIWAWLIARYPDKTLALDLSPQLDLGIDSLEWVTMTLELAERFGIELTEEDAANAQSLRDLLVRSSARAKSQDAVGRQVTLTDEQRAWLDPPGPGLRAAGVALNAVNAALMRGLFRLRVAGLRNVPIQGPFVIACNHLSDLDPLVIAAALGHARLRQVWWGGDVGRLFESRAGRTLARIAHIFPVDERRPASAVAMGEEVLRRGRALVWFPESWRSPDGLLQEFRPGIGHLLGRVAVPVIPARIVGTFEALPRGRRLPRPVPVSITFGTAMTVSGSPQQIADTLRGAVAALPG
jgi:long-chain acyl-CoA synthetase